MPASLHPNSPDSPPKRHSGRPRPQTKVQFHQPTRPPAQRLASRPQGTKATCRPAFSNRRFRFPQNGARLIQSRPTVISSSPVFLCRGETRTRVCVFFLPRDRWRNLRLRRFDRLAPPPLSLPPGEKGHPAAAEVAQRVDTPFAKIVENSCSATWSRGAPVQLNKGKPPLSHQVTRPNSPTCPLVIMTRITRRHDPTVLLKGLSAHLSGRQPLSPWGCWCSH